MMYPSDTRPTLRGACVVLRPPRETDREALRALPVDPEAMRMFGVEIAAPKQRTSDEADNEYRKLVNDPYCWVIDTGDCYVGHIRLHTFHRIDRRAALAIWIEAAGRRNQGLGTAATRLLLAHAFGLLGLHRVSVRVLDINARAIRVYEKCGFKREGVERETACLGERWHDDVIMGVLAHEFIAECERL